MREEVLFKSESDQSREEIAAYLHRVAEKLEQGGPKYRFRLADHDSASIAG